MAKRFLNWIEIFFGFTLSDQLKKFIYEFGPSISIIIISLLVAIYVNILLRKTICESIANTQQLLKKKDLYRISTKISLFVPIIGLNIALRPFIIVESSLFWLNTAFLVACQIVFSLILINIIEPILTSWSQSYINLLSKIDRDFAEKQKKIFHRRKQVTLFLLRILLFSIPIITIFIVIPSSYYVIWGLPLIVIVVTFISCAGMEVSARKQLKRIEDMRKKGASFIVPDLEPPPDDPDFMDRAAIAKLFLEIYRQQLGVEESQPAFFSQNEHHSSRSYHTYELSVKVKNNWQTRRMSIGRLGESASSRCKCFLIIFDEYIVIKISERKVDKLKDYLASLRKEQRIVERIGLEECIIPKISIILKHLPEIDKLQNASEKEEETHYVRVLLHSSSLQRYLKLRDQFVFFMDLSKYYFLEHAVISMHSLEERTKREIFRQSQIAWDLLEFEYRYGRNIVPLIAIIKKIYQQIETQYREFLHGEELFTTFVNYSYQFKQWFFGRLAGLATDLSEGIPDQIFRKLTQLMDKVLVENDTVLSVYREVVRNSIYQSEFNKNKASMEGIVINLLRLLEHLKNKKVAMRDIKPDNLLLAGDKDNYPGFLSDPEKYMIGLIDVETAVIVDTSQNKKIKQPLLGGTPQYATPSHFFENEIIEQVLGDLPKTYLYQDWYAVIGVIFKVITGKFLFDRTAQLVPYIIKSANEALKENKELTDILMVVGREFWNHAEMEFYKKIEDEKQVLTAASIILPNNGELLKSEITDKINSYYKFTDMRSRINVFLNTQNPKLNIMELLELMFFIVYQHMTSEKLKKING